MGRQIGQIDSGAFGVHSAKTISIHFGEVSPLTMSSIVQTLFLKKLSLDIHIPDIYLGLGFEFGLQIIRELAFVCQ